MPHIVTTSTHTIYQYVRTLWTVSGASHRHHTITVSNSQWQFVDEVCRMCRCCRCGWVGRPQVRVLRFTESANELRGSAVALLPRTHRQTYWLDYLLYWVSLHSIACTCNSQKIHMWAKSLQVCCSCLHNLVYCYRLCIWSYYVSTASNTKTLTKSNIQSNVAWNSYLHKITTKTAYTVSL